MRARFVIILSVLAFAASACGGGDTTTAPGDQPTSPEETAPACVDLTGEGPMASVVMMDNFFEPTCIEVSTEQSIALSNQGVALHNFMVEEQDIDVDVQSGQEANTETIGDVLEAGTYRFVCKYHLPGMAGEMVVQ